MPKAKPPDTTDQILDDIRSSNRAILAVNKDQLDAAQTHVDVAKKQSTTQNKILDTVQQSLGVQNDQLAVAKDQLKVAEGQLKVAKTTRDIELKQLEVQAAQLKLSKHIYKVLRDILKTLDKHTFTLTISKEKPPMAVQPEVGSAFKVIMQDNGNPITPPDGTVYSWTTDGANDVIEEKSIDGSFSLVSITVPGDEPDRTTLEISVSGNDPDGNEITGTLTVDIVPAVDQHTYTLVVQQLLDPSINPLRKKASQLPAETPKRKK